MQQQELVLRLHLQQLIRCLLIASNVQFAICATVSLKLAALQPPPASAAMLKVYEVTLSIIVQAIRRILKDIIYSAVVTSTLGEKL